MNHQTERDIYNLIKGWPRPTYPFPSKMNPHVEELVAEANEWIQADSPFQSTKAQEVHKKHRLSDIAARAFPWLTKEELGPIARYTVFFAIIDDYMDRDSSSQLKQVTEKLSALLLGKDRVQPEPGFYYQVYMIRQDTLKCGIPQRLYEPFVHTILSWMKSIDDEKSHNVANKPTSLANYQAIRRQSAGGLPYAKYLCVQKNYRSLPDEVLCHPTILRMHDLVSTLIGYHNDFISLPKEIARGGDVMNIVLSVQREFGIDDLRAAYMKALEIHDKDLAELVKLGVELPDFGKWNDTVREYVVDLGIMLRGVYDWHVEDTYRYLPGSYVEPEWVPQQNESLTEKVKRI